jgi:ATP-dependent protease ClpP protease subunit
MSKEGFTFNYLVNRSDKKYTFGLYGEIGKGKDVNGHYLAHEINYAADYVDVIEVRINSEGGSVLHGLSVFSAMLNSPAKVIVKIDGVAASMAGIIAMAGESINMVDYGRIMIHSPKLDKSRLSQKEKKGLESIRNMLLTIFEKRCAKDAVWLDKVMDEETWFTADEALNEKFIDSIIKTDKVVDLAGLNATEMVAAIQNLVQKEKPDMKEIALAVGLTENATKAEILAKIAEDKKNSSSNVGMAKAFIKMGEKLGLITDENKARFEKLAKHDFELAVDFLEEATDVVGDEEVEDGLEPGKVKAKGKDKKVVPTKGKELKGDLRVSDLIKVLGKQGGAPIVDEDKDYAWYMKNDPAALQKMEDQEPEKFEKLYNAWCEA